MKVKRCPLIAQEIQNLTKDKQELQGKFSKKSMSMSRLNGPPFNLQTTSFSRGGDSDLFASPANMMDDRDPKRRGTTRQSNSNFGSPFDIPNSPLVKHSVIPVENRRTITRQMFGGGDGGGGGGGGGDGGGGSRAGNSSNIEKYDILTNEKDSTLLYPTSIVYIMSHPQTGAAETYGGG
uniref:Uncharacterized protein n=1 Tax=Lactuca sativa TaxID=4236 RepID=A0A9R1XKA2_LACSA|nr:hypothetical protein LSAT_V11C300128680 [Lactuca sativa]